MASRSLSRSSSALGAVVAQVWQAVGTFGLQLAAAWLLGAGGLGLLSLCLGIIVLATALVGGMVGDSLVILNRHDRSIRGGLQVWALVLTVGSFAATAVVLPLTGLMSPVQAALMGAALVAFQLEELVRRLLMATLHFWRLVVMDSAAVVSALGFVGVWALFRPADISTFLLAILIGQLAGLGVGLTLLPSSERILVPLRGAAVRAVAGFGGWRGLQVAVPPLLLTAMRFLVAFIAGRVALGELELARIYVAPALLSVQGLGSYLLSAYVRDQSIALPQLVRRTWRISLGMAGGALALGGVITLVAPLVAPIVSGPNVDLEQKALVGWVLYAAAAAFILPFTSLAAARGRPARVLGCRVIDASATVVALAAVLSLGAAPYWTPFVLAAGLVFGGALVRQLALAPDRVSSGRVETQRVL